MLFLAVLLQDEYEPGTLGFDPLGLKPTDPEELFVLETKELNNGRLAMIGVAGFVLQELAVDRGSESPLLSRLMQLAFCPSADQLRPCLCHWQAGLPTDMAHLSCLPLPAVFEHLALYLEREAILEVEDLDPALNLALPSIP
jgi:light-harvesting complex I chlorophyll a/b binding protein 1